MFKCIPTRFILAFLGATGLMEIYMSRTNLSIAIVEMVQVVNSETMNNASARQPYCLQIENTSLNLNLNVTDMTSRDEMITDDEVIRTPPIKLTTTQRGNILSSFFYTYGITAILGGRLAEKYGTKKVLGTAVLVDALGNLLIPVSTKFSYILLIIIRSVMGFFQGMCYPAMYVLVSKWVPMSESSRFLGAVFAANSFGSIFSLQAGGFLVNYYGYEMAFYVCGSLGLIWLLFWVLFMSDSPETHPRISEKEKNYILENRGRSKNAKKTVPWLKIFSNLHVWAVCIAHVGTVVGFGSMITQLPIYLSSVIGLNIKANGLLSSLPYLARYLGSNSISCLTNFLMKKTNWERKTWLRISTFISHWCPGLCTLLVGYVGCNPTAVLVLFSLAMFFNGATYSGYMCNNLQIAPNFAGIVFGMENTIGFAIGSFAPLIYGALTPEETLDEWITVYWLTFGSYILSGLFFMLCLSTELQPWNETTEKPLQEDVKYVQETESLQKVSESSD